MIFGNMTWTEMLGHGGIVPRTQLFLPTGDELPFNANLVKDIRVAEYRFEHGLVRELEACANRSLEQSWTGSPYFFSIKKPSQAILGSQTPKTWIWIEPKSTGPHGSLLKRMVGREVV